MGVVEARHGDMEQAAKYFMKAIEIAGPNHGAVARTNLGLIFAGVGKQDKALELYHQSANMDPEYRLPKKLLAEGFEKAGDIKKAIYWWEQLLKLQTDPKEAKENITRLRASLLD